MRSLQFVFILFFQISAEAFIQEKVCGSDDPVRALQEMYSITDLVDSFSGTEALYQKHPLPESQTIRGALEKALIDYEEQKESKKNVLEIVQKLDAVKRSDVKRSEVDQILDSYLMEVRESREQLEFELADSKEKDKYQQRQEKEEILLKSLRETFRQRLSSALEKVHVLSANEKKFLVKWVFQLLPEGPRYKAPQEEALDLHKYLWMINRELGIKSRGSLSTGLFYLQAVYDRSYPGMGLHVSIRDANNPSRDINIQFTYSPFKSGMETRVCDFITSPDYCETVDISNWCQLYL